MKYIFTYIIFLSFLFAENINSDVKKNDIEFTEVDRQSLDKSQYEITSIKTAIKDLQTSLDNLNKKLTEINTLTPYKKEPLTQKDMRSDLIQMYQYSIYENQVAIYMFGFLILIAILIFGIWKNQKVIEVKEEIKESINLTLEEFDNNIKTLSINTEKSIEQFNKLSKEHNNELDKLLTQQKGNFEETIDELKDKFKESFENNIIPSINSSMVSSTNATIKQSLKYMEETLQIKLDENSIGINKFNEIEDSISNINQSLSTLKKIIPNCCNDEPYSGNSSEPGVNNNSNTVSEKEEEKMDALVNDADRLIKKMMEE